MTSEDLLKDLLAVIHRDDGSTTERLGLEASVAQARDTVLSLRQTIDELDHAFQRISGQVVTQWRDEGPYRERSFRPVKGIVPDAPHPTGCMCAHCSAARARG